MIVPKARFMLPGLPDVWVYPDDRMQTGFYAIPAHPRVSTDGQGKPEIGLVLYGSRKGTDFEAKGGILTVTVCLALNPEEEKIAASLLASRLAQTKSGGRPQLLSPDWQQGEVELVFGPSLAWREKPSLVGDNRCSFNVKLRADQAKPLAEAWKKGLSNSSVTYHTILRSSSGKSSQFEFGSRTTTEHGGGYVRQEHSSWQNSTSSAPEPCSMEIRGPIRLSQAELDARLSTVGF